jgi:serine/threonine-protein kinase
MPGGRDDIDAGERFGAYVVQRLLGVGATSHVYLGRHRKLGRLAAIKVLSPELTAEPKSVERLLREARLVNDIRHPNIVDIFDVVEVDDPPPRIALIMEHVPGPSLKRLKRRLSQTQAAGVAVQICDALESAHRAGVIHRDLKPDNLLLMSEPSPDPHRIPEVKIIDFGIAKAAGAALGSQPATSVMIGTPGYMAPEQIAGSPPPSEKTDVYAVAEVLYEMMTGRRAFPADWGVEGVVKAKLRGEPPRLHFPDGLSRGLIHWIEQALAHHQNRRPELASLRGIVRPMLPGTVAFDGERSFASWTSSEGSRDNSDDEVETLFDDPGTEDFPETLPPEPLDEPASPLGPSDGPRTDPHHPPSEPTPIQGLGATQDDSPANLVGLDESDDEMLATETATASLLRQGRRGDGGGGPADAGIDSSDDPRHLPSPLDAEESKTRAVVIGPTEPVRLPGSGGTRSPGPPPPWTADARESPQDEDPEDPVSTWRSQSDLPEGSMGLGPATDPRARTADEGLNASDDPLHAEALQLRQALQGNLPAQRERAAAASDSEPLPPSQPPPSIPRPLRSLRPARPVAPVVQQWQARPASGARSRRLVLIGAISAAAAMLAMAAASRWPPGQIPPEPKTAAPPSPPAAPTQPEVERRWVRVASQPTDAEVRDVESGDLLGRTPLELPIAGSRRLELRADGGLRRVVTVTWDQSDWNLTLNPAPVSSPGRADPSPVEAASAEEAR